MNSQSPNNLLLRFASFRLAIDPLASSAKAASAITKPIAIKADNCIKPLLKLARVSII